MLSTRGKKYAQTPFAHGPLNTYNPSTNPNGIISFANAENWQMHPTITEYINTHATFPKESVSYGEMYTGTHRLRTAMSTHLNTHFHPSPNNPFDAEQITFAAGVTALNEMLALSLCQPGGEDVLVLGGPVYGAFERDLSTRTDVKLEYVGLEEERYFDISCVEGFERRVQEVEARGGCVKALMICNPHNPLGRCYSRETLVALLEFCARRGMHLVCDEIYALSVYSTQDAEEEPFTSIRSIDFTDLIDPALVHILYGMSKDFGAGGLRLGCLVTQNEELTKAVRAVCRFASPSQVSMHVATLILSDQLFVAQFLAESRRKLAQSRLRAESLLDDIGVKYGKKGNAGFFLWLDLSPYLPLGACGGDGWAAERLLSERFGEVGVEMSTGEAYHAPLPGRFRFVFTIDEELLEEGIARIRRVLETRMRWGGENEVLLLP